MSFYTDTTRFYYIICGPTSRDMLRAGVIIPRGIIHKANQQWKADWKPRGSTH